MCTRVSRTFFDLEQLTDLQKKHRRPPDVMDMIGLDNWVLSSSSLTSELGFPDGRLVVLTRWYCSFVFACAIRNNNNDNCRLYPSVQDTYHNW